MKKQIYTFVGLLVVITVLSITAIHAQSPTTGKAHIPFDFSVGNKTIAAGDYAIERINSVWMLRGVDNRRQMLLSIVAPTPKQTMDDSKLVFHRYGGQYFLAAFETSYSKFDLRKSAAEKSLEKEIRSEERRVGK